MRVSGTRLDLMPARYSVRSTFVMQVSTDCAEVPHQRTPMPVQCSMRQGPQFTRTSYIVRPHTDANAAESESAKTPPRLRRGGGHAFARCEVAAVQRGNGLQASPAATISDFDDAYLGSTRPGQSHSSSDSLTMSVWKCLVLPGVAATAVFLDPNSALMVEDLPTLG